MLTIDIWMYQNRASSCCMEARFILDCVEPAPAPCRGFTGDCADLPAQFANVVPNPFEGYVRCQPTLTARVRCWGLGFGGLLALVWGFAMSLS